MPFALVAALLASLGLHAAALFIPDVELAAPPEPMPLQAEIVLQPRAAPAATHPAATSKPAPVKPHRPAPAKPHAPAVKPTPVLDSPQPSPEMAAAASGPENQPASEPPAAADTGTPAAVDGSNSAAADSGEPVVSPGLPARGGIAFLVYRGNPPTLIGSAEHRWEMADGRYRIVSTMETAGLAALIRSLRLETESSGTLVAGGLQPDRYVSRRIDEGRTRTEEVRFDHAAGLVRFDSGATAALPAAAQDLLSFNYQLGWLAHTGDMTIATSRKIGRYHLDLLGKEWLETPAQPIWTLHFRASGETTTEVWLAPDKYLLPVKIRHIDKKGERFEQVLEEFRLDPP